MLSAASFPRRCVFHRRAPRALTFAALLVLAVTPTALQATDYNYSGNTGNFSTGFAPAITGATPTDDLIFGGNAYTATDDVSNLSVNGYRFNNAGTVTVARGGGNNLITVGVANAGNAFVDFNNTGAVTVATDTAFATNGYIVKSTAGASTNPTISGGLSLANGSTVQVVLADTGGDATAELSLTGRISGAGALTLQNNAAIPAPLTGNVGIAAPANQSDSGTLLIIGNNTYTGITNINAGRLVITSATALGTGTISIGGANGASTGGTLAFGNGNYTNGVITGGITIANNVNLTGATTGVYGHGIENNTGNNTISGIVTLTGSATIQVNGTTTLSMTGGVAQASGVTAAVTKNGTGTLIFTGTSTYTGGTTVSAGTLVSGSGSAIPANTSLTNNAIMVFNGQYLKASGNSTPSLTLSGLTAGASSQFTFGLNQAGVDYVAITGAASVTTGAQISLAALSGATSLTPGNYKLFTDPAGGLGVFTLATTTLTVNGQTYAFTLNASSTSDVLMISNPVLVPEPGTWALLGVGGAGLLGLTLRQRRLA